MNICFCKWNIPISTYCWPVIYYDDYVQKLNAKCRRNIYRNESYCEWPHHSVLVMTWTSQKVKWKKKRVNLTVINEHYCWTSIVFNLGHTIYHFGIECVVLSLMMFSTKAYFYLLVTLLFQSADIPTFISHIDGIFELKLKNQNNISDLKSSYGFKYYSLKPHICYSKLLIFINYYCYLSTNIVSLDERWFEYQLNHHHHHIYGMNIKDWRWLLLYNPHFCIYILY